MIEATVYGIGFKGSDSGRQPHGFLRKISSGTGGAFFSPDKMTELIKVYAAISKELEEPLPARLHPETGRPTAPSARSSSR